MEKNTSVRKDSEVVDLLHVFKTLIKRSWAIAIVMLLVGALSFGYTTLFIKPKYASHIDLYVNNSSSFENGKISISASELSAAQSLVDTYIVILNEKDTMDAVIDRMEEKGTPVNCTPSQLQSMIRAEAINSTEIFRITVTTTSYELSERIAENLYEVMQERIENIIVGTEIKLVQEAEKYPNKVSPNVTKNTLIGVLVGFVLGCAFFAFFAVLDDTIRNEDQVIEMYDLPILAKIPNLNTNDRGYGAGTYSSYNGYNGYKSYKSYKSVKKGEQKNV